MHNQQSPTKHYQFAQATKQSSVVDALTSILAFTSVPCLNTHSTTVGWPHCAARHRAHTASCQQHVHNAALGEREGADTPSIATLRGRLRPLMLLSRIRPRPRRCGLALRRGATTSCLSAQIHTAEPLVAHACRLHATSRVQTTLTVFCACIFAPHSTKNATRCVTPFAAAIISAVQPS